MSSAIRVDMTRPAEITTTQRYSRSGMGYLWNKRAELDPGQVLILNSIHNNRKKKDIECKQIVTYKLSNNKLGKLGYGRYWSSSRGLEVVEREARGTLCKEFYHDIDIVNCHPVILEQFIRNRYNQQFDALEYYNRHRDEVLAQISPNRDDAKQEVIRVMYGGKNTSPILDAFSLTIKDFVQFLIATGDYADLWDIIKNNDDPFYLDKARKIKGSKYGRFLSYVLQTEEASCMLAMKKALEDDGWSVDVLCYDGVMIRIREGVDYIPSLRKAEAAIKAATGYDVSLIKKEMEFFDVPALDEEIVTGVSKKTYITMKSEFERTHFYHIPTDQIAELNERGEVFFMKKAHAYNYLNPKYHFKHSEKFADNTPFLDVWLKDETRKMVDKIDFKETDDPHTFVIPLQFAYEKVAPSENADELVNLFVELMGILATGPQLDYILNYFAHLLQKPFENPKVALVLTGLKGCGKDTPMDFLMEYVVGALYSKNYDSNEQFFDKHDLGRLNKFLVKLEEADPIICKKNASNLKARITSNYASFNPKGLNPFESANYARNLYSTNKGNPFEMTDGERRFFIANANASRKGDFEYWTMIRKRLFTAEAGRAVADMLLKRDISNWSSFNMPISAYQKAVIESEKTVEQSFVDSWDGATMEASEFFIAYRTYCVDNSLPHAQNSVSLGKRMLPFIRDGVVFKKRTGDGMSYSKTE